MTLDVRYQHVKSIWSAGDLKSLTKMFEIIPKTVVAKHLGMHYHSFIHKLDRPELLNLQQLIQLSRLTDIPVLAMIELAVNDIQTK